MYDFEGKLIHPKDQWWRCNRHTIKEATNRRARRNTVSAFTASALALYWFSPPVGLKFSALVAEPMFAFGLACLLMVAKIATNEGDGRKNSETGGCNVCVPNLRECRYEGQVFLTKHPVEREMHARGWQLRNARSDRLLESSCDKLVSSVNVG